MSIEFCTNANVEIKDYSGGTPIVTTSLSRATGAAHMYHLDTYTTCEVCSAICCSDRHVCAACGNILVQAFGVTSNDKVIGFMNCARNALITAALESGINPESYVLAA